MPQNKMYNVASLTTMWIIAGIVVTALHNFLSWVVKLTIYTRKFQVVSLTTYGKKLYKAVTTIPAVTHSVVSDAKLYFLF